MPHIDDHCRESEDIFGASFREVHIWLDEFAGTPQYGMRHRKVRHHLRGIREAIEHFGPEAESPARQHIISDLREEGWTEADPFPIDEVDYVRVGLF